MATVAILPTAASEHPVSVLSHLIENSSAVHPSVSAADPNHW